MRNKLFRIHQDNRILMNFVKKDRVFWMRNLDDDLCIYANQPKAFNRDLLTSNEERWEYQNYYRKEHLYWSKYKYNNPKRKSGNLYKRFFGEKSKYDLIQKSLDKESINDFLLSDET